MILIDICIGECKQFAAFILLMDFVRKAQAQGKTRQVVHAGLHGPVEGGAGCGRWGSGQPRWAVAVVAGSAAAAAWCEAQLPADTPVKVPVALPSVWVMVQVASTPLLPSSNVARLANMLRP